MALQCAQDRQTREKRFPETHPAYINFDQTVSVLEQGLRR
jgi:hypothetical protein